MRTVVIVGTLDTKGEEIEYVKEGLQHEGFETIVIDTGVLGCPTLRPDVTREQVAKAGGVPIEQLVARADAGADRAEATKIMMNGTASVVRSLYEKGKLDAIICLGGTTGTAIGAASMQVLPLGIPKVLVSGVIMQGKMGIGPYIQNKDITVMNPVTDVCGLNIYSRRILSNAVGAIAGMAKMEKVIQSRSSVAITVLGSTTPAALRLKQYLEKKGYDVMMFVGARTKAIDDATAEKTLAALIDLTPNEFITQFIAPNATPYTYQTWQPNEDRLSLTRKSGIPIIMVPGGLDLISIYGEEVPHEFSLRQLKRHGPYVWLARTSEEEMRQLGAIMAEKANDTTGPAEIVIPLKGFSYLDKEGQAFYDARADKAFIDAIKSHVVGKVKVVEVDAHINDEEFARSIINEFEKMMQS